MIHFIARTKSKDPSGFWTSLPFVASFDDYHEIDHMQAILNWLKEEGKGRKVKSEEIGFRNGQYYAIFYYLKKDSEYRRLVKEWAGPEVNHT